MAPPTKSKEAPPPRRKSCVACVKAKRRCDLASPKCSRCTRQSLACTYAGQKPGNRQQRTDPMIAESTSSAMTVPGNFRPTMATNDPLMEPSASFPDFEFDFNSLDTCHQMDIPFGYMDIGPIMPPVPAMRPAFAATSSSTTTSTGSPEGLADTYSLEDYGMMSDICSNYSMDVPKDQSTAAAAAVKIVQNFHRSMAFHFNTPFLHKHQYAKDPPKIILDVFASCLTYSARTVGNERVVSSSIEENVADLIKNHSTETPSNTIAVARAQALLLYQTIRPPHLVDRDMPVLEKWIIYLADLRDASTESLSTIPPTSWDAWIFWETMSRTILAAAYFINVHSLIVRGEHPLGIWSRPHFWTASKSLWQANSPQDFFATWQRRPPTVVCNTFLNNFIHSGAGDEAEAFASMLLIPYMGLNQAKSWVTEPGVISEILPE